ncbi:MAG: hypothetical protein LBI91_05615 [Spirochaetaceae bacterium]|jgi:hypothetical protein|nr:hypothetical protein [Spirochaetaceae bacterium]
MIIDFAARKAGGQKNGFPYFYSKVWFNTPRLAAAQITQSVQKFGIKPDGIINFLSNEPPFELMQRLGYRAEAHFAFSLARESPVRCALCGYFPLKYSVSPFYGNSVPEAGRFSLPVGRFSPAVGRFTLKVSRFNPAVGRFTWKVSRFNPAVGGFNLKVGGFNLAVGRFNMNLLKSS